jgi:hypothetical protein
LKRQTIHEEFPTVFALFYKYYYKFEKLSMTTLKKALLGNAELRWKSQ